MIQKDERYVKVKLLGSSSSTEGRQTPGEKEEGGRSLGPSLCGPLPQRTPADLWRARAPGAYQ